MVAVVPVSAPAQGAPAVQSQQVVARDAVLPNRYEFRAYTMRPLYLSAGEPVNWQHGLRGKVNWALASDWSGTVFSDVRFYRNVEEETDQVRFPSDLELGLHWLALDQGEARPIRLAVAQTAVIPVDRNRQRSDSFQGAYRIGPQLTWVLPDRFWATPTLRGGGAVQKNLHVYEEKVSGDQNASWEGSLFAALLLNPHRKISLKILGERLWTHQYDGRTSDVYTLSNEVSFALTQQFEFGFGHSNKSNILAADQRSSNVTLISEERSLIYGTIGYVSSPRRSYP